MDVSGIGAGVILLGLSLYLLPAIIALARNHHNAVAIVLLNILLGWTFVGWVIALVLSVTAIRRSPE